MNITITLSNGATISGLGLNGDCLTSTSPVTADMFAGGLSRVTFRYDGEDVITSGRYAAGEHRAMTLGGIFTVEGVYYFWLDEPSPDELAHLEDRADIEYIAMMTGVEL